jgi:hypothetical protein
MLPFECEGLGFNHFCVHSPFNLIEDYTQIFYMIGREDIPAIQYKISLRGPKYVREVVGLSLIFVNFCVAELTPCLNGTETSLQLSENKTLFAVCRICTGVISKET